MDRIWIVLKSEYLRRVKSKGFILTTLLLPIAIALLLFVVVILTISALEDEDVRTIAVVDRSAQLGEALVAESTDAYQFTLTDASEEMLRAALNEGTYDGYLILPDDLIEGDGSVVYYSMDGAGTSVQSSLRRRIERVVENRRLLDNDVAPELLALLNRDVRVRTVKLTEEGEEAGNTDFFIALGFGMGFLIFMMMLIYGSVVMQGVIEEKTSRVVEVVVSSVRPFQLMMGKVLAIGAMGLTQIFAWGVLITAGVFVTGLVMGVFIDPAVLPDPSSLPAGTPTDLQGAQDILAAAGIELPVIPKMLFVWFVIYFLFGYLLFASLYAGVGSLVEQQQDAQSYLLPIMLPVIISMYTLVPQVEAPHSALAVTLSMIPLTSPISMLVRMAVTEVPLWQVLVSVLLLVGGFLGGIWLSARIYRIGILMHGKKPTPKEILQWIRYS